MRMAMKVAVLHDVVEADAAKDALDNLDQARAVSTALTSLGHEAVLLPFSLDLDTVARRLRELAPGAVFNLVETVAGSSRLAHLAPGLLCFLGLPHTGADEAAMFATAAKDRTKAVLRTSGLPTPDWLALPLDLAAQGAAPLPESLSIPGPWIIKPVWEHGSMGIDEDSVLEGTDPAVLARDMNRRVAALGLPCLAERFVDGREFNMAVLHGPGGPRVLPPAEQIFRGYGPKRRRIIGFQAKWEEESFEYLNTIRSFDYPESDGPLLAELARTTLDCARVFGLGGYTRVDFRVDDESRPFIIDINTNPCITPGAGFPETARQAGIDYPEMIGRILASARL